MKEVFSSLLLWIKFPRMTLVRKTLMSGLAAALLSSAMYAQGQGVVDGRIINATNPANVLARVSVDVIGLAGGMSVLKSATTDATGKFHIDGLPTNGPLLIRATYGAVSYYGQTGLDGSSKAQVEIQVYEPTTSWQGITVEKPQIASKLTVNGLRINESYTIKNETKPPRGLMRDDGNFRFSKAPGILQPPDLSISGSAVSMPVSQPPLESSDGQSYYSLYPLRPGITTFNIEQIVPYQNGSYTYRKKFYRDVSSVEIGVMPREMKLSGDGVSKVQDNEAENYTLYSVGPIKAGTEVVWTFTGGTPVVEAPAPEASPAPADGTGIRPMPTLVGQNAMIIGPLLLISLVIVLWYAHHRVLTPSGNSQEVRVRELKARREHLLNYIVTLDEKYERQAMDRRHYSRLREQAKRHLRRIAMLLSKN